MATNETKWKVEDERFIGGGNRIRMSCHHRSMGACGGCYARLMEAIQSIAMAPQQAAQIASDVHSALLDEGTARR